MPRDAERGRAKDLPVNGHRLAKREGNQSLSIVLCVTKTRHSRRGTAAVNSHDQSGTSRGWREGKGRTFPVALDFLMDGES